MKWHPFILTAFYFLPVHIALAQTGRAIIDSFRIHGDVRVTIDKPADFSPSKSTLVIFYALPNGNSTEQTMGKKMQPGDDWHFDIQHIAAQTKFIRREFRKKNLVVIYLENDLRSWPAWKQKHPDFSRRIPRLVDSLSSLFTTSNTSVYLNGHSGGGSLIFGYLLGMEKIPEKIKRISFLDSDYAYDSSYYEKLRNWLKADSKNVLNVFAYNDSIALYNGKPFVSPTGGTWYRSHLMLKHLQHDFLFTSRETDSLTIYRSVNKGQIQFYFKKNLNRGIYHTQQVELNGFIHSVLMNSRRDSKKYRYYGKRAYTQYIF